MSRTCLSPESLARNPAFSQVVVVDSPARMIYVGGQNGVGADGRVVSETLYEQARQAFANLEAALAAAGASLADVVKWNVTVVAGQPVEEGFRAFQEVWGHRPDPPAISVQIVTGLANPAFLLEIDAVAAT